MKMRIHSSMLLLLAGCFILLSSCGGDDFNAEEQRMLDDEALQAYFSQNNISAQKTASGLYYVIDEPGNSDKPTRSTTVEVHYRGYFLDGQQFDSSYDRGMTSTFSLRSVIPGWTEGITLFGVGGKGSLYIISELGYGPNGSSGGNIPANTPIAFDIELISIP